MTENAQIPSNPPEDEIRLIDILDYLVLNKKLIFSIISFFTLSSVIYCLSVTPVYKVAVSFLPSHEFHISEPIVKNKLAQIQQGNFRQFIDQIKSPDLQRKVATEGDFLESFKDGPDDTSDTAQLISRINRSINTTLAPWNLDLNRISPSTVEMTGKDPKIISEFLNALSSAAIKMTQDKTFELIKEEIFQATKKLDDEIAHINEREEIDLINEKFNINLIEQEIKILRNQAKALRLGKIKILEDHLKVARNFTAIGKSVKTLGPFDDFAFLNGEKNIQALINNLKKRTNDDLFSPEIIRLQELLEAYKDNQIGHRPSEITRYKLPLKNLKIKEPKPKNNYEAIIKLIEAKKRNLEKRPEVIIVSKKIIFPQEPISPEKTKLIVCAIFVGAFFGIFIAILRSGLRILKQTKFRDST